MISIIRAKDLDGSIAIENANPYGNAAGLTQSGGQAREVMERASAGMIGVNIGVPFRVEPFSLAVGMIVSSERRYHRKSSIEFWTSLRRHNEVEPRWQGELDELRERKYPNYYDPHTREGCVHREFFRVTCPFQLLHPTIQCGRSSAHRSACSLPAQSKILEHPETSLPDSRGSP